MNKARRVEAITRMDVAIDQLLTAYLLVHEQDVLTEQQNAAVQQVLDLIDLDVLSAWRMSAGQETMAYDRLVKRMEFDLKWRPGHSEKVKEVN